MKTFKLIASLVVLLTLCGAIYWCFVLEVENVALREACAEKDVETTNLLAHISALDVCTNALTSRAESLGRSLVSMSSARDQLELRLSQIKTQCEDLTRTTNELNQLVLATKKKLSLQESKLFQIEARRQKADQKERDEEGGTTLKELMDMTRRAPLKKDE